MSLPQLQEAGEVFAWLIDYYAPALDENGKFNWTQEDRELFNQYSDLLIRCATARLPFEYPKLNAIGIAAVPGSSCAAHFGARCKRQISFRTSRQNRAMKMRPLIRKQSCVIEQCDGTCRA